MQTGHVYLIGAGPGDPSLLTIKAARALSASDVVVYDDLVNSEILTHARRGARLIAAGKRGGAPSTPQDDINAVLVAHARSGRVVARLKGGDPFVFGRGGEEAEVLTAAGISWEVIPGISSGIAAAAFAGIPLTHRDHASSVAFVTGHEAADRADSRVDWGALARGVETLVVFMCARTIGRVARRLVDEGKPGSTPVAVIRWGTYDQQEVFTGTLAGISASGAQFEPPALAVIGDVVRLREKLNWFEGVQTARRKEAAYAAVVA